MTQQFCPQCGHENPIEAKFCMECGSPLASLGTRTQGSEAVVERAAPDLQRSSGGTDWAAIAAAVLAFLSLRHLSRRARNTTIVITFLVLFFGCPMVCGFAMYVMEWFARLIG
jgi:hypothetical protein